MRPQAIRALSLSGLVLLAGPVSAQEPPRRAGLDEAVRLLHENSPELALARARVREAEGSSRQAAAFPNPFIAATHETLEGAGPGPSETYVNLRQRVEWPGRRAARARAAGRALEAARARYRADSLRLVFEVRRAYLRAAAADERLRVLEEVGRTFRQAADRADRRFSDGDVSRYVRDRIRLEHLRYERSLAASRVELETARRALGALILPDHDASSATDGLPPGLPPEVAPDAVAGRAVDGHPAVWATRFGAEALRAEADLARSLRIPDPTLTAGYKTQSNGFDGLFVGVALPLPVSDRKAGAIAAAEARLGAQERRLALARRAAARELSRAAAGYRAARAQAALGRDRIDGDGAALLEAARVAYDEGEIGLLELLDAAAARRDAGVLAAELRADAWTSYYELIRASGGIVGGSGSDEGDR